MWCCRRPPQVQKVEDAKLAVIVMYGEEARYSKSILIDHLRRLVSTAEKVTKPGNKPAKLIPPSLTPRGRRNGQVQATEGK
jgi:hypothetical protein